MQTGLPMRNTRSCLLACTYKDQPLNSLTPAFQDFLNNEPKNRDDATNIITQNFLRFKEQMQQVFEDFDKEHTAERKMQVLRQTGLTAEYVSKF